MKSLLYKSDGKLESWRSVTEWLEQAGYRSELSFQVSVSASAPENTVVNITNMRINQNNQITIGINLQITVPLPSDLLKENPLKENPDQNGTSAN